MKHSIRAFSVGLFTSGIIMLIIFLFFGGLNDNQTEQSDDDMITELEDNGYHVVTDSEYVSLSVQKDENRDAENDDENSGKNDESENNSNSSKDKNKDEDGNDEEDNDEEDNDEDSNNDEDENEEEAEDPNTYSLTIEEGMASSDIGAKLEDNDIIDDAGKFNRFLEDEEYELKVQIGSYKVSDDMNFDEIAQTITK